MKQYLYGAGGALVLLVLGYIQYLRTKLRSSKSENVSLKTQVEQSEWKSLIDQAGVKVNESEKDFREAVDNFRSSNTTSSDSDSQS